MKTISINDAQAGDKLARDLKADDGTMILSKGAALSIPIISRLSRMGITRMTIEGGNADTAADLTIRLAALEKRFRGTEQDPFLAEMYAIAKSHITGNAGESATPKPEAQPSPTST